MHPRPGAVGSRVLSQILAIGWVVGAQAAEAPLFSLPVACEIGRTCFVQNYVDLDPGPAAKDHACGTLTYDGHNGTDFRLPTTTAQRSGVDVLAAADGRVLRRRDGMADVSVRESGREAVQSLECGNAVVIEHTGGWETQYCHMAQGSLRVKPGDTVKAGQPIGRIGLSGLTEYPHLHFTVRHQGKVIDPFAHEAPAGSCRGGRSLWRPSLQPLLAYQPRAILNEGFAATPVTMAALEADDAGKSQPGADAAALVAYVRGIGLKAGDMQSLTVRGPAGQVIAENRARPVERNQAQTLIFAGKKRPANGWERGTYTASYSVTQEGNVVLEKTFSLSLP